MAIQKVLTVLRDGGVVLHPTDTCYGYACHYFDEKARARLCALKKMSTDKPLTMMLGSIDQILEYAEISPKAQQLIDDYLPGQLTIILPAKSSRDFPKGTIGVRVPDHLVCHQLCEAFGKPLVTTSANITGEPPRYSVQGLEAHYIIDHGPLPRNKPSTIVRVEGDDVEIIRQGDLRISV
jgi:tRNA threonylcarbamoyl adenosine modification protein (Sua5/YciO/YrdC/YwlC family)